MKRIFSLATILLLTVAFSGCDQGTTTQPAGSPPAVDTTNETSSTELDLNQVAFGIEGMT